MHRIFPTSVQSKSYRLEKGRNKDNVWCKIKTKINLPIVHMSPSPRNHLSRLFPKLLSQHPRLGTENEVEAREFGQLVGSLAKELSRYFDLSRLESVFIGWDYAETLASVDRGEDIPPAAPTANEYGQGGAMALNVVRKNEIGTSS